MGRDGERMRGIKKLLLEHGSIPSRIKCQKLIKAYGELYLGLFEDANSQGVLKDLSRVIFNIGRKNGERFKKEFDLDDSPRDAAFSLLVGHKLFGIKSRVADGTDKKAVIQVEQCPWEELFPPEACDVLGNIEKGACNALNPNLSYTITKKLTDKDEICEFVIEAVR
jgi:hypothetical protein